MNIAPDEVRARVEAAYGEFLERDGYLLSVDANERSITHKFAEHLQRRFPDWHVDCEYNRNGSLPKKLVGVQRELVEGSNTDGKSVYPDVIVHRRGSSGQNLVVIEAKKSTTSSNSRDIEKLSAYKSEHGYKFAYAIVFPVGDLAYLAEAARDIYEDVS